MNKTAIKNFAVRARRKLIEDITQKVYELGITKNGIKEIETFEGGFKVQGVENSKTYKKYEIKQREKLIEKINRSGYEQVIEEVAYTWFNRFIALRFMEVNEYLPTGVRVLSSQETGKTEPDIIKEALNVDLGVDKDLVYRLIDENDTEDLYKYLLVRQCNELGKIMPMVFEEISDYTELLLPDNLLAEGSVIRDLVHSIEEEDYKDQVEIIGWMYQYYISEKKDEVFADLKKNKKITKENIPAATQLFTPKWIVKYMIENSLGRLWLESHPDEELKTQWKYYLDEAGQDPEVQKQLNELKSPDLNPENIKVVDPSMGSGHILVYAFDVLYDIYLKANYSEREIPQLILEKNIYGLDIDDRAGQLAAFALMMKARSKNKRIFRKKLNLNTCSIKESNGLSKEVINYFVGDNDSLRENVEYLINIFKDAKEYGSILDVKKIDFDAVEIRIEEIRHEDVKLYNLQHKETILEHLPPLVKQGRMMNEKYDVVCTNPPYMGSSGMNPKLSEYVKKFFPDSKNDLFAVFIEKCNQLTKKNCFQAMITQHSWMFISSFEKLRIKVLHNDIVNMAHLGSRAFEEIGGEVVQTTAFVLKNVSFEDYKSTFIRLVNYNNQFKKENAFLFKKDIYITVKKNFSIINGCPIAYWANDNLIDAFRKGKTITDFCRVVIKGIFTGDNERFLRKWYEVNEKKINNKWKRYSKGGFFRRWYGNLEYIINWENNANELRAFSGSGLGASKHYNLEYLTWTKISSSKPSFRINEKNIYFDDASPAIVFNEKSNIYILGLLNSIVVQYILEIVAPTLNFQIGDIKSLPIIYNKDYGNQINERVNNNIIISKNDWDSFETSWDFQQHPLLKYSSIKNDFTYNKIETAFSRWSDFTNEQFEQLKHNEEELNRIFIDIYGLQDELTSKLEDKDITIRKADRERDIKSFISYAVGCMFGRYSLDEEGLIYAGGEFNSNRYRKYIPTGDNVLVIADDDYFEDDIVNRLVEFIRVTFGEEALNENLNYIAETLGQKTNETSRQTIRRYFLKGFYDDHVKTFSKRPIYWLFDSGKQNGFKALIYLHRYDSSTVARVRIDYLHKLQKKYEAELKRLDLLLETDLSPRDAAAAKKKKESISKQIQECLAYDQVISHVANQKIEIDLDDGVVVNYEKFQNVEVPQGEGKKPIKANLLAKI